MAAAKERVMTLRILECHVTLGSAAEQLSFQRACSNSVQSCDSDDITQKHLPIIREDIFSFNRHYFKACSFQSHNRIKMLIVISLLLYLWEVFPF